MSIPTPNWYRDVELRIMKLEVMVANLNTQIQAMTIALKQKTYELPIPPDEKI